MIKPAPVPTIRRSDARTSDTTPTPPKGACLPANETRKAGVASRFFRLVVSVLSLQALGSDLGANLKRSHDGG
jgi:hypothetical protein